VNFPELCITGYTCSDLFLQQTLLKTAESSVYRIIEETKNLDIISVVGVPVAFREALYNCAAVIFKGKLLALVPKANIPNYSEFYEARHYTSGKNTDFEIEYAGRKTVLTDKVLFQNKNMPDFTIGVEVCEDLWVAESPSIALAKSGATVICNPSTSDDTIGKAEYRRSLVRMQSGKLCCAYIYTDSGFGESTTDTVYSAQNIICENASLLSESERFTTGITYADIDVQKLMGERRRMSTFCSDNENVRRIYFDMPLTDTKLSRKFEQTPFVPSAKDDLSRRCKEIITMQATGLATRLAHTGIKNVVLGLSGGLDSTLALIVCVHAFDMLGIDRKNIHTVTMPCFGTTKRTKSNAEKLAETYNVSFEEINITAAVRQHFIDIKHDESVTDITYENSQARERTKILMNLSNKYGGLVIGTGDLSELALGWATYNGDHMSMYAVNVSIPKTLVRYLTAYEAEISDGELKTVLLDVLDTPVSPELLPPDKNGEIAQKTEDVVGPYELHDFFLYYFVRFGFTPSKIYYLAKHSFAGKYNNDTIKKWLVTFLKRFFSQQFKRSCLPDGPKVGSVTLSPRSDWRMPSDASVRIWLDELENQ
jgi:NAD+ synthase (glutamine-hydrolysing)